MANTTLTGSSFYLGESSYNGPGSIGSSLYLNNAQVSRITMMTDPSSITGQPYSGWNNTSTNSQYYENYGGDDRNLDLGEAVRMNIDGDGNLSNDPWLRVTDFDRYGVDIRMEDGSIIHGVGVIISARDPSTGKVYQSMVFGDDLVATLNNTNMNLNRIVLTSYIPTGNDGGDLTQRFLTTNFANNVAEFAVVPCFARGTLIATDRGQVPVEDLARGDRVVTSDHGFQKVRWIGSQTVRAEGKMAPVVFAAGAIGNDRELAVSPQHRMLVSGPLAEALYGESEVMVPAKSLINDSTIRSRSGGSVEYFHILLGAHEVIFANGAPAESLYPGPQALKALDPQSRDEILTIFPELADVIDSGTLPPAARTFLTVRQGRELAARGLD